MSHSDLAEFIETQCVPRLTAEEVYREVKFHQQRRGYYYGPCPLAKGKSRPNSFQVDAQTLRWSCLEHCRRGGQSVLSHLNGGDFPHIGTNELEAALEKAAHLAGIPPTGIPAVTPDAHREWIARERIASLLETFFLRARVQLRSSADSLRSPAEAFLARHGFEIGQLEDIPLGLVDDRLSVRRRLEQAGYTAQEIEASLLTADERLVGRLIGPIRDRYGRILSFWARDLLGRSPGLLFKGPWKDQTPLVGLDTAFAGVDPIQDPLEDLLVFERLFDALLVQSLGFPQAAAIAGPASDMTPARWERLAGLGVRRATLIADRSESSRHSVLTAVENALQANPAPAVWVLLPGAWDQYATAAALVRARGLAEFQSILKTRAVHAYHYKALALLAKHRPASGWSDPARHAAWKEAIEFCARSDPEAHPDLEAHFVPAVVAGLERSWDAFQPIGAKSYCRIHHCDTSVCFCFD